MLIPNITTASFGEYLTLLPFKMLNLTLFHLLIIAGNSVINTPAETAAEFNKHFCSIGKKLSDEANILNLPNFDQYLINSLLFYFLCQTTVSEVFNLINQLNCNKSCGADGIAVFW